MRKAGLGWLRADVPFPFSQKAGTLSAAYASFREKVVAWHNEGFKLTCITPYPRGWELEAGEPGSEKFLSIYREACAFMAKDLAFAVPVWQVSNELNLAWFRRPFNTEEEAIPFLIAGGVGIREGNPQALVGLNMATGHEASAYRMQAHLYPNDQLDWDYIGMDAYYGTWEPGGPETWPDKLEQLHEHIQKPLIVMEFGYPSKGGVMTADERGTDQESWSTMLHKVSNWPYGWDGGHTPEAQARYVEAALDIFVKTEFVRGAFWYNWADGKPCNCGNAECPEGSGYGMVTLDREPKPAYHVFAKFQNRKK